MNFVTLLYYKYTPVADPAGERQFQRKLCERLGLKGRILIATEGINGTVAGSKSATDEYMKIMAASTQWSRIEFKIDESDKVPFPRLRIKVRDEIVTLGVPVDPADTAPKLTPAELNELLASNPDVVLFDARNNYESAIGKFKNAITPDISLFKDLPEVLDEYEDLKDKTVVAYCTGGIRCEKATALMKQRGFSDVRQLDGGIIKYAQTFPDDQFEGACFVFDERMSVNYGTTPKTISACTFCSQPTSHYQNCANPQCHALMLVCEECRPETKTCSAACSHILSAV